MGKRKMVKKRKRESVFKDSDKAMKEGLEPFIVTKGKKRKKKPMPWDKESELGFM